MSNILTDVKVIRAAGPAVAGTTTIQGSTIDMQGFNSALAILDVGALTATQVTGIKWQGGNAPDGSDGVDLAGTKSLFADADSNSIMLNEIEIPIPVASGTQSYRYLTPYILRGTANAVINSLHVVCGNGQRRKPTVQDASVTVTHLTVQPAAGTP